MCQKVSHPMQVTLALERLVELLGSDRLGIFPGSSSVFGCVWGAVTPANRRVTLVSHSPSRQLASCGPVIASSVSWVWYACVTKEF